MFPIPCARIMSYICMQVKRTGRQSVLLLLMSGVLAVGTVSVVAFGGTRTVRDIQEGRRIGFNSICGEER